MKTGHLRRCLLAPPCGVGGLRLSRRSSAPSIWTILGVLVAFVMFVYYSAIVFVFGAAYVASLDSRRR